jgi:hypothetical protein
MMFYKCFRVTCVALVSCLLLGFVTQDARADLVWGANGHPFTAYYGVSIDQQLAYLHDLGMTSYRVNNGTPEQLSALAQKAKKYGITILPVLAPEFDYDKETPETLYRKGYEMAFALVSPLKSEIHVWELGNEMEIYALIKPCEKRDDGTQYNCDWGIAGGNGELDYYGPRWAKVSAVLKGLSEGTIAADPTALKAMGTAGWGHLGVFKRMEHDGIKWDISVWHMYGEDPEWAFKEIATFKHPIWVTELNHPKGSATSAQEQADGLRRWMGRMRELQTTYHIEAAHIYELMDEPYWAPSFEAFMGLVHLEKDGAGWRPGTPKPAYDVVRSLLRGDTDPMRPRDCDLKAFSPDDKGLQNQVQYSYCLILGRLADGQGLSDWTSKRANGMSAEDLLRTLARSDEFGRRYAVDVLSDDRFITLSYQLLLGRDPDGQGREDYLAKLGKGGITRIALLEMIMASDEFKKTHKILFP